MITVQIAQKAYEAIESMDFEILDVLRTFGSEVWENNSDLYDNFTERQVVDAFVQLMLEQSTISERFSPEFF